jgi:hypothetical protein
MPIASDGEAKKYADRKTLGSHLENRVEDVMIILNGP